MKLEDITCDLQYAKKLKELGIDQTSSFAVFYGGRMAGPVPFNDANQDLCGTLTFREDRESQMNFVATFTMEELLNILPKEIKHNFTTHSSYFLSMGYDGEFNTPIAWYEDNDLSGKDEILILMSDKKKFANALAKVLIWLLKENRLKFVDKNTSKKEKVSPKTTPADRVVYDKMEKHFYSFKHNCWFYRTNITVAHATPRGFWYSCKLVNKNTGKTLEEFSGVNRVDIKTRFLSFVNNPAHF